MYQHREGVCVSMCGWWGELWWWQWWMLKDLKYVTSEGVYCPVGHQTQNRIFSIYSECQVRSGYVNWALASKSSRSGLDSLPCTTWQGNMELPKCVERGLLEGSELQTSLEWVRARRGSGESNHCEDGSKWKEKTLKTIEERHPTGHKESG